MKQKKNPDHTYENQCYRKKKIKEGSNAGMA